MSHVETNVVRISLPRAWRELAPKLVAFAATGLTGTGLVGVLALFGLPLEPAFAVFVVGAVASLAGYLQSDPLLLKLPANQLVPKVLVFIASTVTGTGVLALLGHLGVTLDPTLATGIVTVVTLIAGYFKRDSKEFVVLPS
jgi:hypothetical protein